MARKIKFALEMADGYKVRSNIEELREHFDIESVMGYFLSGKLQEWLEDRYYETEADQLSHLDKGSKNVHAQICKILGVTPPDDRQVNLNSIELLNEKRALLRQVTDDEEIIEKASIVAFDQEQLSDLIDSGEDTIYLCGDNFNLPAKVTNMTYIGVNNPKVCIAISSCDELDKKSIIIKNAILPDNLSINPKQDTKQSKTDIDIQALSLYERTKQLYGKEEADAEKLYLECKYDGLLEKFKILSSSGVERANYFIVQMLFNKYDNVPSKDEECTSYRKFCLKLNDSLAKIQGAYIYPPNTGDYENIVEDLIPKLKNLAMQGDPFAYFELGGIIEYGYNKLTDEYRNDCYQKSANLGNPDAMYRLGVLSELSNDYSNAIKFYEMGNKISHPTSQNQIGILYYNGQHVTQDIKRAFDLFSIAASKGNAGAAYNLATCYFNGFGTNKDYEKAVYWSEKSAKQGNKFAQNMLGECYRDGLGVKANYKEAFNWFRKAATDGYDVAQYNIADLHLNGSEKYNIPWQGIPHENFFPWLEDSVKQGNVDAMVLLADTYIFRNKNEEELQEAERLYKNAASKGNKKATEIIKDLEENVFIRKVLAASNNIEYNNNCLLSLKQKTNDIKKYWGIYESFHVNGCDFYPTNIEESNNYLISNLCPNYTDSQILYLCCNYIPYPHSSIDISSSWILTNDKLIIHDTNGFVFKKTRSFFRTKYKIIEDIFIPYTCISKVSLSSSNQLIINFNSSDAIVIPFIEEIPKADLDKIKLGCWRYINSLQYLLNIIINHQYEK